jgi:hypothetical protein
MVVCALDPSAGLAVLDLMNFDGDQIETIPCTHFTSKGSTTFGVLRTAFSTATPLGLKLSKPDPLTGDEIILGPSDGFVVTPDMSLLLIAEDIASALASSRNAATAGGLADKAMQRSSTLSLTSMLRRGPSKNAVGVQPNPPSPAAGGGNLVTPYVAGEGGAAVADSLQGAPSAALPPAPRCIIFIGWMRGFESLLRLLDARLPPGSEVHILSEQTELARQQELESEGLALDGSCADGESDGLASGLTNCTLEHVYGFTTDERAMRKLPLSKADSAVVVADTTNKDDADANGGEELQIADAEAITSTVLLRRLRQEIESERPNVPQLTIVTEFVDLLTRRLLERQSNLITSAPRSNGKKGGAKAAGIEKPMAAAVVPAQAQAEGAGGKGGSSGSGGGGGNRSGEVKTVVFHRNYIETTTLSLASHSDTSWLTVQLLLDAHSGYDIVSLRVGDALPPPPKSGAHGDSIRHSFNAISDYLSENDVGLLIGWRKEGDEDTTINPKDKGGVRPWKPDDELILLKRTPKST